MASIPFVDSHVHFFDLQHDELVYSWLAPEVVHPIIGNIDAMKMLRYDADAYVAETRFANVSKVVHVQAAIGSPDPVSETKWLQQMSERTGVPDAAIAHSDLRNPDLEAELERHASYPIMRGVRDFSEGDYLVDPVWQRGYALLERFDMVCDLDCPYENMGKARDLARRFPNIVLVLEHVGYPRERSDEYFRAWQGGMRTLAEAENAFCKISGLGMCDQRWTVDSIRPWVMHAIDVFGTDRCFFGTNWPVDRLFSSYDPLVDAYAAIISGFSAGEQKALFSENAERVYRI